MANRRLLVAALRALVLLASACSTSTNGVPSLAASTVGSSANPSSASPSGFPSSAFSTSTESGGATAPASSAAGASNASGPVPGDRSQPGGDAGARAYLAQKGWLDATGRVIVAKFSDENDEDVDDDSAFCSYVFGPVSQVQSAAKLDSTTTFDDDGSGDAGTGSFDCAYSDTDDDDVFVTAVGIIAAVASDQEGGTGVVLHPIDATYDVGLGYAPGTTAVIGNAAAVAWLTAAAARVDLSGITKDS